MKRKFVRLEAEIRGGAWHDGTSINQSALAYFEYPLTAQRAFTGFRLVRKL